MAEQSQQERARRERETVGSVAEETARLVEALGGWAEGLRAHHDEGDGRHDEGDGRHDDGDARQDDGDARQDDGDARHDDGTARADSDPPPQDHARAEPGRGSAARCEHCGVSTRAGEALACRVCPVCQGIALLRTVRPETVERLADVAAALSGALRDIAADRFGQPPPTPQSPPPRGQKVQDIVVDDEDDDDEPGAPPRTTDPSGTRQESTAP